MERPKFSDLLDEYLYHKSAYDQYRDSGAEYGPGGQMLYDRMDDAKKALDAFFPPTTQGEGE